MASQPQLVDVTEGVVRDHWGLGPRIAFRFCFVYFGLYCLSSQIITSLLPLPDVDVPDLSKLLQPLVAWVARHIFDLKTPLSFQDTGSGDKTCDWILNFCILTIAVVATLVWSWVDRKRESYPGLFRWFRLFLRLSLAGQMFVYGFAKIVPLQMPFPFLKQLLEPFGQFSPMGVLWSSIGASPAYEIFTGCVETLAGVLLIVPRTFVLGAMLAFLAAGQIFMLNMTYDVPVKLLSLHLILFALFLLAPDLARLTRFLTLQQEVEPLPARELFAGSRANRLLLVAQLVFGLWLVGMNGFGGWKGWHEYGPGRAHSPLYGIWDVEQLSIDGQARSPLLTDYGRFRRAIFDFPTYASFERMDGSFAGFNSAFDVKKQSIALTKPNSKNWKASLTYQRPAEDQVLLDGEMDSRKVHMQLKRVDVKKFLLVSRGFHWVQEFPFNR